MTQRSSSLLFSKIKEMVVLGLANVGILLVVMAVKRYVLTSVWCALAPPEVREDNHARDRSVVRDGNERTTNEAGVA